MRGDVAAWMYVLAGIAVSAVVLSIAAQLWEGAAGKGDPWPLYTFLESACGRNASGEVVLRGPFVVEVENTTFCYGEECRELSCSYHLTFGVGKGYYTYRVEVEDGEVRLWPLSRT